ncbi:aldo/keto reductase [Leptospira wolffii]|uniref:Aldo/keto reductase n=1 Tax=Leptospira wolffii TaxID=409998 RepID=A0A2M9Z738_9LEPT|nr:aldo/keto reductase [Leptospira wolffii]PJZ64204.1 aldo/keto reductase [Leptospira wolffii]TGK55999.1 aldo/keto reductase [Leptospira wolffii]TGK72045.1 aldo/keto reductase [Leptospira wolffii]TGK73710.1 aldo/keto reductase [Leptospira wolffii]TGL27622.1 aldo/keto reductase [Leptospira wolffii]
MKMRRLGADGPTVSELALGCMGMSDFYGSKETRDRGEAIATIHAALDSGINLLNTGDFYGIGHNELLISEALKTRNDKPLISVKFGALRTPQGGFIGYDARPASVKNFAAYSLTRLGADVIDIYQPSRVDPSVPIEETVGAIKELIQEGKVRYLGMSEASPENLRRAHKVHPVTALEIEYSLATRVLERELLQTCRELGIGIVAYGVVGRGLLTGKIESMLGTSDFRSNSPRFQGKNLEANLQRVSVLEELAKKKGCTTAQLAIAWVLHQGQDIVPLIGSTRRASLAENLEAQSVRLSPEELKILNESFPEGAFQGDRYPAHGMQLVVK